jgi:hypothetical protein
LPATIAFVGIADLADSTDSHLCREAELLAQIAVVELLEADFVGCLVLESALTEPLAGSVDALYRGKQSLRLFIRGEQFSNSNELHNLEDSIQCTTMHDRSGASSPA